MDLDWKTEQIEATQRPEMHSCTLGQVQGRITDHTGEGQWMVEILVPFPGVKVRMARIEDFDLAEKLCEFCVHTLHQAYPEPTPNEDATAAALAREKAAALAPEEEDGDEDSE